MLEQFAIKTTKHSKRLSLYTMDIYTFAAPYSYYKFITQIINVEKTHC